MNTPDHQDWTPQFRFSKRFWVGCAVLLLSVSFAVLAGLKARDAKALSASPIFVEATVIEARQTTPTDASEDSTQKITYQFVYSDQFLTFERSVPIDFFQTHPEGTTWTIRTHLSDPSIHDLYEGETRKTAFGFVAASVFMALIGAVFMLAGGNLSALRARFR